MTTVLGIDAAWTEGGESGVALARRDGGGWRCLAVAPSYAAFVGLAHGVAIDWLRMPAKGEADVGALLDAAERLAGVRVDVVTIDMPVATVPITARRIADDEVSREFGGRHCGTHSPSAERPGTLGLRLTTEFGKRGYRVATADTACSERSTLVEVYPHTALLELLDAPMRVPYKTAKTGKYWPDASLAERRARLFAVWRDMHRALAARLPGAAVPMEHLDSGRARPLSIEQALDALVCAWTGARYVDGGARAYGDATAAIWSPVRERGELARAS